MVLIVIALVWLPLVCISWSICIYVSYTQFLQDEYYTKDKIHDFIFTKLTRLLLEDPTRHLKLYNFISQNLQNLVS